MAESNDSDFVKDESATPDSPEKPEKKKKKGRKKKKRGCGFFLLLLLLLAGVAAGIQASGGADFRPFVYEVLPKIPFVSKGSGKLFFTLSAGFTSVNAPVDHNHRQHYLIIFL